MAQNEKSIHLKGETKIIKKSVSKEDIEKLVRQLEEIKSRNSSDPTQEIETSKRIIDDAIETLKVLRGIEIPKDTRLKLIDPADFQRFNDSAFLETILSSFLSIFLGGLMGLYGKRPSNPIYEIKQGVSSFVGTKR